MFKKFFPNNRSQNRQKQIDKGEGKNKIVFLTGSGISEESGLGTFRGKNGIWNDSGLKECSSIREFYNNPQKVIEFYYQRQEKIKQSQPNKAHQLIADFVCSSDWESYVITQNVDNLHEKAGSREVIHLHGQIKNLRCRNCLQFYEGQSLKEINCCLICGSYLLPDVVLFGESVSREIFDACKPLLATTKHLVIIGTTLKVFPASYLLDYIKDDCTIWIIDPNDISLNKNNTICCYKDKASKALPQILKKIDSCEY